MAPDESGSMFSSTALVNVQSLLKPGRIFIGQMGRQYYALRIFVR